MKRSRRQVQHRQILYLSLLVPRLLQIQIYLIDDALTGADPRIKVVMHSCPLDSDPFSEDSIRMANPHYDEFMNKIEVLRQAEDARRMPSRENSYRNLILNQRVEARSPFVSRQIWASNGDYPEDMSGRNVFGGLDLSSVNDLTALVLVSDRC